MPRFCSLLHNRIGRAQDEEGEELGDVSQRRRKAIERIRSILSVTAGQGMLEGRGRTEIVPEKARAATVPFAEAS